MSAVIGKNFPEDLKFRRRRIVSVSGFASGYRKCGQGTAFRPLEIYVFFFVFFFCCFSLDKIEDDGGR